MRIVLDTNVTFSALLWRGTPYQLVETIRRQRQDHLFTSPALLEELADILTRPFAAKHLALLERTGEELLADYAGFAEMVTPRTVPAVVIADPDDDQVIAAAIAAKADIIASGDHHLLSLGTYQGIRILPRRRCARQHHRRRGMMTAAKFSRPLGSLGLSENRSNQQHIT